MKQFLTEEQYNLIIDNIVFARAYTYGIIKKWPSYEWDDAFGDGMVGLVEAAYNFDPSTGLKFVTYAGHRIRREVLDGIRRRNGRRHWVSGKQHFVPNNVMSLHALGYSSYVDGELQLKEDFQGILGVEDNYDDLENASFRKNLVQVINRFGDRDKMIFTLYYFEGMKMRQIGELYEMTESRVCQILKALNFHLWYVLKEVA